ncbi:probable linoleate 9S-lipoxygenase 5 [Coffea arabica]|uniref:Lipoxygenase n=1 Tax=Coffea arabica TaxID=13443 RepID=A0A6P6VZ68_COFAR|nr:probable linoleate 9S-lipoxygenase 5 [Coffea arabica]
MKKHVLDFNDFSAAVVDLLYEFLGKKVSLQLVSSVKADHSGKLGTPAYLENWITTFSSVKAGESALSVTFDWDEDIGVPGAFIIKNFHQYEFYLKTLTLENVPGHDSIHFVCNSCVYPADKYKTDRIFFSNQAYLPNNTSEPLKFYREAELANLRGDGTGELKEWDRIYDYACYNDLGDPDRKDASYVSPILGGSVVYPYPRRGRTGRPCTKTDPNSESGLPLLESLNIYVPRDERFGHLKMSDFLAYELKSISQFLLSEYGNKSDSNSMEFDSFEDVQKIYEGGIKIPKSLTEGISLEFLKQVLPTDGEGLLKYPLLKIIEGNKSAWRTDEEFAREMLAGLNTVIIRGLHVFPPSSKLDPKVYGNQSSTITRKHIENKLEGMTIQDAIKTNRLFILDHHDTIMPYLRRINATPTKTYASRTLLFLQKDGTLKPLAIELRLPHPDGDKFGSISKVYTPAEQGVENSIWQLAKAYVAVNDSGIRQLITHWLHTHAVIGPIVIATNRQLSVLHPVYKLLHPHFRDTMNINAISRQILTNAKGIVESTLFPSVCAMEMSSLQYRDWVFPEQALPADLIKRQFSPYGLRLIIHDYPYAVDGLKIWSAIKTWVTDYCSFFYKADQMIQQDTELQAWWKEFREKGHADKKDEKCWPQMKTITELINSCTIIIWLASALHAATNFGQWPYAGFQPNRPTTSPRFMPEPGTEEYEELKSNPDKAFLKTIASQPQTLLGLSTIEILSRHTTDEVYLGQRENPEWTKNSEPLEAFKRFGRTLSGIEDQIQLTYHTPCFSLRVKVE